MVKKISQFINGAKAKVAKAYNAVMNGCARGVLVVMAMLAGFVDMVAQTAVGYEAGTKALTTVSDEIAKYIPIVTKLCYALAGVVAIIGAISVYIKMNNEEQDVKKSIMLIVGACIFLVAAAQALPAFFGL